MLKITVDETITPFFEEFGKKVLPFTIPSKIGNILVWDIQDRFRRQVDIEEKPWEPLSGATIERRKKLGRFSTKILEDTRQMLTSLHVIHNMPPFQTAVAMSKFDYKFNINVPKLQDAGGTGKILEPDGTITTITVPARPFMGASMDALEEIEAIPGEMYP